MNNVKTTVRDAHRSIRNAEPFDAGNLRGYWGYVQVTWARCPGWVGALISEGRDSDKYVVYSYNTPIGWFDADLKVWVIPVVKYSVTTSGHQSRLRRGAELSGYPVEYPYEVADGQIKIADEWK